MMPNLCEPRLPVTRRNNEDHIKIIEDSGHDNEDKKEARRDGEEQEEDKQDNEDNWDNYEEDDFELRTAQVQE